MMEEVYIKVFDETKGDVVFEGKVSTDVKPHELVYLRCFWDRGFDGIYNIVTKERVKSFKGLQNHVELVAGDGVYEDFAGVLYVGADDKVLRKSESVPSCECAMMSLWYLSHEECEKAFECHTLEVLEMYYCELRQIPNGLEKSKELKKLRIEGLYKLKSISEEIGELSNLEELQIGNVEIESLPKRLKDLNMLKSISIFRLYVLHLNAEDLVVFSRLKHVTIRGCCNAFTPSFAQSFWEMVKSTTADIRVLDVDWMDHDEEMVVAALEENGSIVDGGKDSVLYADIFKRNKENQKRAMECVLLFLAFRRWRNALNHVPKEIVKVIAMMLWITKCNVQIWGVE